MGLAATAIHPMITTHNSSTKCTFVQQQLASSLTKTKLHLVNINKAYELSIHEKIKSDVCSVMLMWIFLKFHPRLFAKC